MAQVHDALIGALLGDALGVFYEFLGPASIPPIDQISLPPPAGFNRSHPSAAIGAWSDDGAQLMSLLEVLLDGEGKLDLIAFGQALLSWRDTGRHQHESYVFDCGMGTERALDRLRTGVAPALAGGAGERDCGNGSLMRCLPAALLGNDVIAVAVEQSLPTHRHPVAIACCAVYSYIAWSLLVRHQAPVSSLADEAFRAAAEHPAMHCAERQEALRQVQRWPLENFTRGSGYCTDTLWSALHSLERADDYLSAIRLAVSLGNDTDSTACVAGGIASLKFGLASVPEAWWSHLKVPPESAAVLARIASMAPVPRGQRTVIRP